MVTTRYRGGKCLCEGDLPGHRGRRVELPRVAGVWSVPSGERQWPLPPCPWSHSPLSCL